MVTYLLVGLLIIVLLCIVLYVFFFQNQELSKKRVVHDARSEYRVTINSSSNDLPLCDGISQPVDNISSTASNGTDESIPTTHEWLRDSMALTFSAGASPKEKMVTLLRIDNVRDDVRRDVLSHIVSLKNFDTIYQ
jgi:hypothetical protein